MYKFFYLHFVLFVLFVVILILLLCDLGSNVRLISGLFMLSYGEQDCSTKGGNFIGDFQSHEEDDLW